MACSTARLAIDYSKVPADWVGYVEYLDNDPHFNSLPKVDGLDVFQAARCLLACGQKNTSIA